MTLGRRIALFILVNLIGGAALAVTVRTPVPVAIPELIVRYPDPETAQITFGDERETVPIAELESAELYRRAVAAHTTGARTTGTELDVSRFGRAFAILFAVSALLILRLPQWVAHVRRLRGRPPSERS